MDTPAARATSLMVTKRCPWAGNVYTYAGNVSILGRKVNSRGSGGWADGRVNWRIGGASWAQTSFEDARNRRSYFTVREP